MISDETRATLGRTWPFLILATLVLACSSDPPSATDGVLGPHPADGAVSPTDPGADSGPAPSVDAPALVEDDAPPPVDDAGMLGPTFCSQGTDVPGATVPGGFCLRHFASVPEARTMAFAPNGDLFVGAPSAGTPGGASGGLGGILVLSDDDQDGVAEQTAFATGLMEVHGLAFGDGYLYFTTKETVWRTPYTMGQRTEQPGARQDLRLPASFGTGGRWTHGLAHSVAGTLFASRGQYGSCGGTPGGEISQVTMGTMTPVATGFRNPMYMRCHFRDNVCAATELGEDGQAGAKEKLIGLLPSTNYGYPCCYTKDKPVSVAPSGACTSVRLEDAAFVLSETPFGFDWERGIWPEPYKGAVFVALHGSFYTTPQWAGARVVMMRTDPTTHMPLPGEIWRDFVGGFGPGGSPLDRPSDVTFAPDGRMFFADDHGGGVYWVAPASLRRSN